MLVKGIGEGIALDVGVFSVRGWWQKHATVKDVQKSPEAPLEERLTWNGGVPIWIGELYVKYVIPPEK
jgi:hypothetical protein